MLAEMFCGEGLEWRTLCTETAGGLLACIHMTVEPLEGLTRVPRYTIGIVPTSHSSAFIHDTEHLPPQTSESASTVNRGEAQSKITTYHPHSINLSIDQQALLHIQTLVRAPRNVRNRKRMVCLVAHRIIRHWRTIAF
jgi:hypothetical protein